MAKNVFKPAEIVSLTKQVNLESPFKREEDPQELSVDDEYLGPTADDLRREAEAFKVYWASEKEQMISSAKAEAEKIKKEAEEDSQNTIEYAESRAQLIKSNAEKQAESMLEEARLQAEDLIEQANKQVNQVEDNARLKGIKEGREEGYNEGKAELDRLIEHLRTIISAVIEKRNHIIDQSEKQIVELVLLICKKVVKVISENQKNVVINNVVEALKKLKNKGEVVIRVNIEDQKITNDHIGDFIERFKNVKSVTVLEDSTVDKGGCIIETDFGHIDARISSQLREIEENILDLVPILSEGNV